MWQSASPTYLLQALSHSRPSCNPGWVEYHHSSWNLNSNCHKNSSHLASKLCDSSVFGSALDFSRSQIVVVEETFKLWGKILVTSMLLIFITLQREKLLFWLIKDTKERMDLKESRWFHRKKCQSLEKMESRSTRRLRELVYSVKIFTDAWKTDIELCATITEVTPNTTRSTSWIVSLPQTRTLPWILSE